MLENCGLDHSGWKGLWRGGRRVSAMTGTLKHQLSSSEPQDPCPRARQGWLTVGWVGLTSHRREMLWQHTIAPTLAAATGP